MKIAVITNDGKSISQHFGRAAYYVVFTVEENRITGRELHEKMGHNQFAGEEHHEHHGPGHGMDEAAQNRHAQMAGAIADCQVLLCGGMVMGAYVSMKQLNIQPIITELLDVDQAVNAYMDGNLVDRTERLH
jgi:predicted Fe-Mo cluster-binding NifX family protein